MLHTVATELLHASHSNTFTKIVGFCVLRYVFRTL